MSQETKAFLFIVSLIMGIMLVMLTFTYFLNENRRTENIRIRSVFTDACMEMKVTESTCKVLAEIKR